MKWFKSFWKSLDTPVPPQGSPPPSSQGLLSDEPMRNFTPRAQQVLSLAREEAQRFRHHFVGTEHVLLGLIRLGQGTAVTVLGKMGVDLENARREVEKQVGIGPDQKSFGIPPYTPRVKKALALAVKESKALNHTYVGTEHLLLGLLREGDGVAARVLKNLGIDTNVTRQHILRELDPNYAGKADEAALSQKPQLEKPDREKVDLTKRYDVYCREADQQVIYRNVLFKGIKTLFQKREHDIFSEYIELAQQDGTTVLIARASVIKFCEHGTTPSCEPIP